MRGLFVAGVSALAVGSLVILTLVTTSQAPAQAALVFQVTADPADLRLTKIVDNPTPNVGDTITFTVTLSASAKALCKGCFILRRSRRIYRRSFATLRMR